MSSPAARLEPLDLVRLLIGFDTTSRGTNLPLIDFAQELLEAAGARCRRTFDAARQKANLFATLGPDTGGGYVLSGHTDVVPVDGQEWSSDPFHAVVRDNRLFGRGTCDMKSFIGVALSLLPEIARATLKRPIHFALSYDEEVGCAGVPNLLEDLRVAGIAPALAIIGEPTDMRVVGAHKSGAVLHTHCHGREGHSSAPEKGANAVMMAGEFIKLLDDVWTDLRADTDPRFDPPHTTVQANMISGGSAVNILGRDALVTWEYRALPDRDPSKLVDLIRRRTDGELLPKYRARAAEARFETALRASYPGLVLDEASPAIALAREITGANQVDTVAYGTEAGHFQHFGIPAVICGPGSIDQAHKADEFVALPQLGACETFLRKVIAKAEA
ncbi:MAG: acetylornithine deacetylase [Alphaproteobacteria bacterium]|nr:acetylornithine deacetylase [Alphaproteobacteria bacterium]MBL6937075.1 acetylornithine deacetylase [Alphaproteobacteria bacterium]MBL7096363.1 acetylornithine deacetylase [Alphaproteobacteria bacterium]